MELADTTSQSPFSCVVAKGTPVTWNVLNLFEVQAGSLLTIKRSVSEWNGYLIEL